MENMNTFDFSCGHFPDGPYLPWLETTENKLRMAGFPLYRRHVRQEKIEMKLS